MARTGVTGLSRGSDDVTISYEAIFSRKEIIRNSYYSLLGEHPLTINFFTISRRKIKWLTRFFIRKIVI